MLVGRFSSDDEARPILAHKQDYGSKKPKKKKTREGKEV